jgi:hypothetical protein
LHYLHSFPGTLSDELADANDTLGGNYPAAISPFRSHLPSV